MSVVEYLNLLTIVLGLVQAAIAGAQDPQAKRKGLYAVIREAHDLLARAEFPNQGP